MSVLLFVLLCVVVAVGWSFGHLWLLWRFGTGTITMSYSMWLRDVIGWRLVLVILGLYSLGFVGFPLLVLALFH